MAHERVQHGGGVAVQMLESGQVTESLLPCGAVVQGGDLVGYVGEAVD
jgi:hypothetical protein